MSLDFIIKSLGETARGIPATLLLVGVTLLISAPLAFLIAKVNLNPKRALSRIFRVYISFVRSIPLIVIVFILYHSIPLMLHAVVTELGMNVDVFAVPDIVYGCVVFSFATIPILAEVFRAGLMTVPKAQFEAAYSVGLTTFQTYTHIIIPQFLSASMPVLCSSVTNLVKMTSLAFLMSIKEITGTARIIAADSIRYVESYLVIFIIYLIICLIIERVFKRLERRFAHLSGQTKYLRKQRGISV